MIAIFEIEEQCLELGGGEFEPWVNRLEGAKHLAVMRHYDENIKSQFGSYMSPTSWSSVVEASTGLEGEIGLESRSGKLYVSSDHPNAFVKLVALVAKEAIEGPLDREA